MNSQEESARKLSAAGLGKLLDSWSSAFEREDYVEAYGYACALTDLMPEHWLPWCNKGFAVGFLSTTERPRLAEMVDCFKRAMPLILRDPNPRAKNMLRSMSNVGSRAVLEFFGTVLAEITVAYQNADRSIPRTYVNPAQTSIAGAAGFGFGVG